MPREWKDIGWQHSATYEDTHVHYLGIRGGRAHHEHYVRTLTKQSCLISPWVQYPSSVSACEKSHSTACIPFSCSKPCKFQCAQLLRSVGQNKMKHYIATWMTSQGVLPLEKCGPKQNDTPKGQRLPTGSAVKSPHLCKFVATRLSTKSGQPTRRYA